MIAGHLNEFVQSFPQLQAGERKLLVDAFIERVEIGPNRQEVASRRRPPLAVYRRSGIAALSLILNALILKSVRTRNSRPHDLRSADCWAPFGQRQLGVQPAPSQEAAAQNPSRMSVPGRNSSKET